jgi:hypothetical protein
MFIHHNPLDNENDYNYFVRCVDRFNKLLLCKGKKLFVMAYYNMCYTDENFMNEIIDFNKKFSKYTYNYILLVIFHIPNKKNNYFKFTLKDNIHFLELHTLSKTNGLCFENNDDNIYLNSIINSKYKFNIIN